MVPRIGEYTGAQMTYDLRRLRLKGLIFRPPKTHRYFLTPYGWKVARLFARLEARVFRPGRGPPDSFAPVNCGRLEVYSILNELTGLFALAGVAQLVEHLICNFQL